MAQSDEARRDSIGNDRVRVEAWVQDGRLHERYLAKRDQTWIGIAASADEGSEGPACVYAPDGSLVPGTEPTIHVKGNRLVETFGVGDLRVERRIDLAEGPWIHVTSRMKADVPVELHAFIDRFTFLLQPDWSYAPSVGGFIPDGQYKAPLILVQKEHVAFGIVPDVAVLDRAGLKQCNHAMDLDVPAGPVLSVGFMPSHMAYHSVFAADPSRKWKVDPARSNQYYILVTASAEPGQAYREAVRFHWSTFGRPAQAEASHQQVGTDPNYKALALMDDWRVRVWEDESRKEWLPVALPDGTLGGGVQTQRWGPGPSVYFTAWFNTLRTSYGMALYARRIGNAELLGLAQQTVALAVEAPGRDGAFKCIAVPRRLGAPTLWAAGDGCGDSTEEGYLGYDMSWTGYWLLRWKSAGLPGSDAILDKCRALAGFMMARQMPDGMIPTRFREDGSVDAERSRVVKAETGPATLFLLELYSQDPDPRYLTSAEAALDFLDKEIVPSRKWYDFETFWSCSPRVPNLDIRTHQYPANDLALSQTVEAYLVASRVTGEKRYLDEGEALLDYLLLYQQCWTNPALENLSCRTMLLGGFTTQNSDAEWSDARQSQCGNVLIDYYRETGKAEYLERGVAALRAQFPISPSENWAHSGYGKKAGISSFHWGSGSGMAGIEIDEDFIRDAVVDVAAARGVGVDGLDIKKCTIAGGQIQLSLYSPFTWHRKADVIFKHAEASRRYRILVNGFEAGTWFGKELEAGVLLAPGKEP